MKVRLSILILLSALLLQSCDWMYPAPQPQRNMVLYYASAHNNGLSSAISNNIEDIKAGYLPADTDTNNVMIVYYHLSGGAPRLSRFCKNSDGEFIEEVLMDYPGSMTMPTYSLQDISIEQVLKDAQLVYPSTRQSLIFSTHGSGYFPEKYTLMDETTNTKAMGPDDNLDISIVSLAKALNDWHFDVIMFDCCFMGGIEIAYELSDICDYVIGAPTETMTAGIVRNDMIEPLFTMEPESAGKEMCRRYMAHVRNESQYSSSGTIGMYKTSELPELAGICRDIFLEYGVKTYEINPDSVQKYHRVDYHWFFDFDDFVKHLLTDSEGTVDEMYSTFSSALSKVVIFKDTTPRFLTLPIDTNKYSGLNSYLPRREYSILNSYYKTLKWNKATKLVY